MTEAAAPLPESAAPATDPWPSRLTAIAVASALFMEFIDSTALSVATPTLARAFGVDPIHLKLALTAYIVALAVFAPASGWVAERWGARRVFLTAMGVFLAGSIACGFSRSLGALVGFRVLQGLGGAMMTPVGRFILVGSTPKARLVSAMSWFSMPALVGPFLGPPIAGLILSFADWPWIFFVNIPVCLIGMAAVMRFVKPLQSGHPGRFDSWGFVLVSVAISGLAMVAETAGQGLIPWWLIGMIGALSLVCGIAYIRHARRTERPVLRIGLFRHATYRASVIGGTWLRLGLGAGPFLTPLLLQVGLGWSPLQSGLIQAAQPLGALCAKTVIGGVLRKIGYKRVLIASVLIVAVFTAAPAFYRQGTPPALIGLLFFLGGLIRSVHFTSVNTVAYADVPAADVGASSTLSTVAQQVSMALGISFGGLMLHLTTFGGALTPERFTLPFLIIGMVGLGALPTYLRLPADAGASLRGSR